MSSGETVSYKEVHAYMLRKTQEYYRNPPAVLVQDVIAAFQAQGDSISYEEAKPLVSLIHIQRYVKKEMTEKWPEFMASIRENSLAKTLEET